MIPPLRLEYLFLIFLVTANTYTALIQPHNLLILFGFLIPFATLKQYLLNCLPRYEIFATLKEIYISLRTISKMPKRILLSMLFTCLSLAARADTFGLGAVIGDPTGVSVKMWLDQTHAIDGAFAWSLNGPNALHVQSDYLVHELSFFHIGRHPFNLYYGGGGRLSSYSGRNKSGLGLGARAPLGVAYQFRRPSVELFAEMAAILELVPSTDVFINIGLGGRFYF
jgi:hypothetical protein